MNYYSYNIRNFVSIAHGQGKVLKAQSPVAPVAPHDQDTILSRHCVTPCFQIDTGYRRIPQHDLRVKHAWYRLLRLLAARVFHTIVTFQKKSGPGTITTGWIPNKLNSGFQWLDSRFHELDSGFQSHGFRIPQAKIAWIPYFGYSAIAPFVFHLR